jgi:hypothetical protein
LIADLSQITRQGSLKQPIKELTRKRKTQPTKREDHEILTEVLSLLAQLAEKRSHIFIVIDEIDAFSAIQSSQTLFMFLLRNLLQRKKSQVEHEIKSLNRKIVASKPFLTKSSLDIALTFIGIANSVELFQGELTGFRARDGGPIIC